MKNQYYHILAFLALSSIIPISADEERTDYSFPPEEYEHYMKLIQEINPKAYTRLRTCENDLGAPCIEEAVDIDGMVDPGNDETMGHPIIVMKSLKDYPDPKAMLKTYLDWYDTLQNTSLLTQNDRNQVLDLIKIIAPEAYEEIIKVDPTGENHIQTNGSPGFMSNAAKDDGLPIIYVDHETLNDKKKHPREFLEASIGHELGHYVSGHFFDHPEPTHAFLFPHREPVENKNLPAKKTFNLAQQRIREHEADRSEIMDFNIDIDTAIRQANAFQIEEEEFQLKEPSKETFKRTHPIWADRIKHFESLRKEIDLKKAHEQRKTVFDWKKLAKEYKKALNKK